MRTGVRAAHKPVCLNDQFAGTVSTPDAEGWACWTPTDPVTPVAHVFVAVRGLPARTGVGGDGLEPGKESLDRLTAFQGSSAGVVKLGLASSSPARIPLLMPTFWDDPI